MDMKLNYVYNLVPLVGMYLDIHVIVTSSFARFCYFCTLGCEKQYFPNDQLSAAAWLAPPSWPRCWLAAESLLLPETPWLEAPSWRRRWLAAESPSLLADPEGVVYLTLSKHCWSWLGEPSAPGRVPCPESTRCIPTLLEGGKTQVIDKYPPLSNVTRCCNTPLLYLHGAYLSYSTVRRGLPYRTNRPYQNMVTSHPFLTHSQTPGIL